MQLWSGTLSPFSAKVRIVCREKSLSPEIHDVAWTRKNLWNPKPAGLLEVSPRAEVPVLIDDGLAIFDSTVIDEYLDETGPAPKLLPADSRSRAQCRMLEDEADRITATHVSTLIRQTYVNADESKQDQVAVQEARGAIDTYMDFLNAALGESSSGYLCADYSVADIATYLCLGFAQAMGVRIGERPHLLAWLELVGQRPAVKEEFETMMAAAAAA